MAIHWTTSLMTSHYDTIYTVVQKNAPTSADYNYDPVQSILIIFSKLLIQTRTVLTRRVSSYGLPAWVSSELGPMGGTTFTTSAAALEPGHY